MTESVRKLDIIVKRKAVFSKLWVVSSKTSSSLTTIEEIYKELWRRRCSFSYILTGFDVERESFSKTSSK